VRIQLHGLAYNLGNFLRMLETPEPIKDWSLTSKVRRENARWHPMPTPGHTRPNAVPPARRVEPRRATRCQERKLQKWRLD
jgi:hypothetical protein